MTHSSKRTAQGGRLSEKPVEEAAAKAPAAPKGVSEAAGPALGLGGAGEGLLVMPGGAGVTWAEAPAARVSAHLPLQLAKPCPEPSSPSICGHFATGWQAMGRGCWPEIVASNSWGLMPVSAEPLQGRAPCRVALSPRLSHWPDSLKGEGLHQEAEAIGGIEVAGSKPAATLVLGQVVPNHSGHPTALPRPRSLGAWEGRAPSQAFPRQKAAPVPQPCPVPKLSIPVGGQGCPLGLGGMVRAEHPGT